MVEKDIAVIGKQVRILQLQAQTMLEQLEHVEQLINLLEQPELPRLENGGAAPAPDASGSMMPSK
jgi:vacuolar-type H+-ATPase subunit D/Vma8